MAERMAGDNNLDPRAQHATTEGVRASKAEGLDCGRVQLPIKVVVLGGIGNAEGVS